HPDLREKLQGNIRQIGDLERLISKIGLQKANPREIVQLKRALIAIDEIKVICDQVNQSSVKRIAEQINPCVSIKDKIERELQADPPILITKGKVMADGLNPELDRLRKISYGGKDYLLELQKKEAEITGITSLKIAFNNVFGYYLEVSNTHKDKVPQEWIRKQTLVNAERYITPELKEYEDQILGAEEKIHALESQLFNELVATIADYIKPIQLDAYLVAQLDVLLCFASIAKKNYYNSPSIS